MKLAFWRRSRGRHALGAAVTSIPSGPPVPAALPDPASPAEAAEAAAAAPAAPPSPAAGVAPPPPAPAGPRVELGFRDGTRASLDPSSEQAKALEDLASVLTRRD